MRRRAVIDQMMKQLREELEFKSSYGEGQWVYAMSLNTKELDEVIETSNYNYTIATKVIIKMGEVDLVDGTIIHFHIETDETGEVEVQMDLSFIEEIPMYNGGTVENAVKWISRDSDSGGKEIVYLDMRDEKYSSYKSY